MSHERIQSVSFQTNGCLNTNAWANTVAELAEVRKVEDAWEITAEDVIATWKLCLRRSCIRPHRAGSIKSRHNTTSF